MNGPSFAQSIPSSTLNALCRLVVERRWEKNKPLKDLLSRSKFNRCGDDSYLYLETEVRLSPEEKHLDKEKMRWEKNPYVILDKRIRMVLKQLTGRFLLLAQTKRPSVIDFMTSQVFEVSVAEDKKSGDTVFTLFSYFMFDPIPHDWRVEVACKKGLR